MLENTSSIEIMHESTPYRSSRCDIAVIRGSCLADRIIAGVRRWTRRTRKGLHDILYSLHVSWTLHPCVTDLRPTAPKGKDDYLGVGPNAVDTVDKCNVVRCKIRVRDVC